MNLSNTVDSLVKRYERSPVVRALVQLIPMGVGSAVDTAVLTLVQAIRADRARIFFDELANGKEQLCPELLENNEFIHCYFATATAALRTQQAEKIQALARLLCSSAADGRLATLDEYEEFLSILSELSYREISILALLDDYESRHPKEAEENDLQRANRFWDEFVGQIARELSVRHNEVDSILIRLNRSGCYETFTGGYFDYTGGKGKITPLFHRLKELALNYGDRRTVETTNSDSLD